MSEITPEYVENLKKELESAKQTAAEATTKAEKAEAAMKASGAKAPVTGSYKGYSFDANHRAVRDKNGQKCDSQALLDAANDKNNPNHAAAVEVLDWLIKIEYAYFTKAKSVAGK